MRDPCLPPIYERISHHWILSLWKFPNSIWTLYQRHIIMCPRDTGTSWRLYLVTLKDSALFNLFSASLQTPCCKAEKPGLTGKDFPEAILEVRLAQKTGYPSLNSKVKVLITPTLCDPVNFSLPGSSVHGILQARILEWVGTSFSRGFSWPRDRTQLSHIAGRCFPIWATRVPGHFSKESQDIHLGGYLARN